MTNARWGWDKHARLVVVWGGLQLLYLASAILCFVSVFAWRGIGPVGVSDGPSLIRRFATTEIQALIVTILGSLIALNVVFSIVSYLLSRKKNATTRSLTVSNAVLGAMMSLTLLAGTYMWFCSLRQVQDYAVAFSKSPPVVQGYIQDMLQCCGYYNGTSAGLFTSSTGYCSGTLLIREPQGCVSKIIAFSDKVLNTAFTAIYGIVAIQFLLFLATACLRVDKIEKERFSRIEKKRGLTGGLV